MLLDLDEEEIANYCNCIMGSSVVKNGNLESRFGWQLIPLQISIRWGCNKH